MKIENLHTRILHVKLPEAAKLIDSLSSKNDLLWPYEIWPRMILKNGLKIGSSGGHGPVKYFVDDYEPGVHIRFKFTFPKGFNGFHEYHLREEGKDKTEIIHLLEMDAKGLDIFGWLFFFKHMHDAFIEDSFTKAEKSLGLEMHFIKWNFYVKILRFIFNKGKIILQKL